MFCWKALIDIVCVFFFFLVISAIVWWLSKSIEHVFELHKIRTSQIFHHQSTYWFVSMMRFFFIFFPFCNYFNEMSICLYFSLSWHRRRVSPCSSAVRLDVHNCATSSSLFFCGLWFYRQQVNETNKTRRMIALSKNRQTTNCNTSSWGDLHVI